MKWKSELPSIPGWYWAQWPYSRPEMAEVLKVFANGPLLLMRWSWKDPAPLSGFAAVRFAGPIPEPAEPTDAPAGGGAG